MKQRVYLHVPALEELWYRERLMKDSATMGYNRGYAPYGGYDPRTGCIAFPERDWAEWYGYFIGNEPQRFYAYIVRQEDGAFIGEVNVHKKPEARWYEMGIVLEAKYRGCGYAPEALWLLLEHVFEKLGGEAVHNCFEPERAAAVKTHLAVGFTECGRKNGMLELLITREAYFREKEARGNAPAE